MAIVRRISEMVGMEGATFFVVQHELKRTGILSPSGNVLRSYPTLHMIVLDEVYRPHSYEEIAEMASQEVAGCLLRHLVVQPPRRDALGR